MEPIIESVIGYLPLPHSLSLSLCPNEQGMMEGTYGVQKVQCVCVQCGGYPAMGHTCMYVPMHRHGTPKILMALTKI